MCKYIILLSVWQVIIMSRQIESWPSFIDSMSNSFEVGNPNKWECVLDEKFRLCSSALGGQRSSVNSSLSWCLFSGVIERRLMFVIHVQMCYINASLVKNIWHNCLIASFNNSFGGKPWPRFIVKTEEFMMV